MTDYPYVPWVQFGRGLLIFTDEQARVVPAPTPCDDDHDLVWTGHGFARMAFVIVAMCRNCLTPQPPVVWRDP